MSRFVVAVAFLALVAATFAMATPASLKLIQGRTPTGWHVGSRAGASESLRLIFAVKQNNMEVLKKILYEVSDPRHPNYGQHLSLEEVNELTANPAGTAAVVQFLKANGVAPQSITMTKNGGFVTVKTVVSAAESLLQTQFYKYTHSATMKTAIKTPRYSVPVDLAVHLDFVSANCMFPTVNSRPAFHSLGVRAGGPIPPGYTTPQVLWKFYGIADPVINNTASTQSVYENLAQSYSPSDLTKFQNQFDLLVQPIVQVYGPNKPFSCLNPDNCVEATLDVEYIMAIAQNSPTTFWSIPDSDPNPFLDWIITVGEDPNPPLVHSVSYGDIEPQDDFSVDNRFDGEVQKLGARGISVFVASGDDGVANFIARDNRSACGFTPSFPATSPHVTAVGATQGPEDNKPEIACTSTTGGGITTGGGFSVNPSFTRPDYQNDAVIAYMNSGVSLPPSNLYAGSNRGYPDVAMMGHNYITILDGQMSGGSGTSASTPVFAAVVTHANSIRLSQGKSALGFLNPALYQLYASTPSIFRDITSGENNCCAGDGSPVCCQYGFQATRGWDPLTGLGSVDFPSFVAALVDL